MVDKGHGHKTLQRFARSIGLKFRETALLRRALTHTSFAHENQPPVQDNERLEFLGDSVLGLTITHYLLDKYPSEKEGYLAKIKSTVVSEPVLAKISERLGIGEMVLLGRGEQLSGGRQRPSILADTIEAIIGAFYLDSGFKKAQKFILSNWHPEVELVARGKIRYAYRSELQELIQKKLKISPEYILIDEQGPDNNKIFTMQISVKGLVLTTGTERTKKAACQTAAKKALEILQSNSESGTPPDSLQEIEKIFKRKQS